MYKIRKKVLHTYKSATAKNVGPDFIIINIRYLNEIVLIE